VRRYVVIFEDSAKLDVRASYEWGLRVWGKREASIWARQLREAVLNKLGIVPKAFPLAPEDDEFWLRFVKWLSIGIVCCLQLKGARFMCSM
jgi:hypothetical protein